MPSFIERKPHPQVIEAKHEFANYLRETALPSHYLVVTDRTAPLRRADGDRVIAQDQVRFIRDKLVWDGSKRRWTRKSGTGIVTEDELYDVILGYQRLAKISRMDSISIKETGFQPSDVRKARQLWKYHCLEDLDATDDTVWGAPTGARHAVYDQISRPSGSNDGNSSSLPNDPMGVDPHLVLDQQQNSEEVAARRFHPEFPHYLHIGYCTHDGTDVWMSMTSRSGKEMQGHLSFFYDSKLKHRSESELGIEWHDEFKYSSFPGSRRDPRKSQRKSQRDYIFTIKNASGVPWWSSQSPINNPHSVKRLHEELGSSITGEETQRARRIKRDPQSNADDAKPIVIPDDFDEIPINAIAGTVLLVLASHRLGRGPANVPFNQCSSLQALFKTMIVECKLEGKAATALSEVTVTYTWNDKQHLIRRDRPRDWVVFCDAIRTAWSKEAGKLSEDGCEIKVMVHVNE